MSTANASRMMVGKVCLVTGALGGHRTGDRRAGPARGARHRRWPFRRACAEAARQIREDTRSPAIEYLIADLSSQAEIRRLAGEIQNKTSRLDVVNNAGGIFLRGRKPPAAAR